MYQPDPVPPDVLPQLPSAANRGKRSKRVNREMHNRNAFAGKLGAPKSFRTKTSDMHGKARTVQRLGDLRQLPFTSALSQPLRQQQHRDRKF